MLVIFIRLLVILGILSLNSFLISFGLCCEMMIEGLCVEFEIFLIMVLICCEWL